ncbi:(1-_4)-alpha-D-glucan synthase (UDP-glucose) [Stackebrandtia albiflava]|uniref:(1->4)-alpha-D-glucan synthase (UDP-glucose) n=2 Tax=Stackebrandtia albiflava TaxID=406432 RepID=A0A562UQW5_9ACTN|nr:(1->4)-alpha-D-glucan synthase (UDP-glucose) [Stackebrandtia albiflava]
MLSWEYPPVLVGGLGRHVHALATALAAAGHTVTVATRHGHHADGSPAAMDETVDGVRIVRAPQDPPLFDFHQDTLLPWTLAFNHALTRTALRAAKTQDFDVVHAHDWLVTHAAVTLKHHLELPLVATLHSTEAGRHQGWLPDDTSRAIHSLEWWLTYEARRVLTCSAYMRDEVDALFDLPADKTEVVPNGVDVSAFASPDPARVAATRSGFGGGPIVLHAGRLVHEKGVQDLLDAAPSLAAAHPGLRVLIAGEGPWETELRERAARLGLGDTVRFLGFVSGENLPVLLAAADCFTIPSRYEPFGMVALEAVAAGTVVVAAASGGLAEFIIDSETGMTHRPGDPAALAAAVSRVLTEPALAARLRAQATEMIDRHFTWGPIATQTVAAYRTAADGERDMSARLIAEELRVVIPEGNLFSRDRR